MSAPWIALAILLVAKLASACQCNRPGTAKEELAQAEVVFIAAPTVGAEGVVLTVRAIYKGDVPERLTLHVSDCVSVVDQLLHKPEARERGDVLVYAYRGGERFYPTMCGGSGFVADALADVAYLDAHHPPRLASSPARLPASPPEATNATPSPPPAASAAATRPTPPASAAPREPPPAQPRQGGCGCSTAPTSPPPFGPAALVSALVGATWRRRRRRRSMEPRADDATCPRRPAA